MAFSNIDKPSKYFNTVTWTGNSSTQSITGVGFSPDFIWKKSRSQAYSHRLSDNVRGGSKVLNTDNTNAEATDSNEVTSFDSDGFTLGNSYSNFTGHTHVGWCWDANGTGVSNTAGTISSTVSANTTSGFSIVSFTGNGSNSATVGHGLGVVPKMIIEKSRTASFDGSWWVNHNKITSGTLRLNSTDATRTDFPSGWINESPTSSTFSFTAGSGGTVNNVNYSGDAYIAYCFAEVKGFSKFGSYTGNGSTDGTFVYTGFKPAFVMIKGSSNGGDNWFIFDNKRTTYNVITKLLYPNASDAELDASSRAIDFLSNGFKLRNSDTSLNYSGWTYIYMAFAENPFCSSKGIACTAR